MTGTPAPKRFMLSEMPALDARRKAVVKASAEQLAAAKERARKRRIALFGPFSLRASAHDAWVTEVLSKRKLTILTGGRLGPVKEIVEKAIGGKAKNISVILDPWASGFPNLNIKGKARNVTIKGNEKRGTRPFDERLTFLHTHKVKAYVYLPTDAKPMSGTHNEFYPLIHAYANEPKTSQTWRRPIILIGKGWNAALEVAKQGYEKQWPEVQKWIHVIETKEELEKLLDE